VTTPASRRIIIALTGSSGSIYGIRLLELLHARPEIETHLVLSDPAKKTLTCETDRSVAEVEALADVCYDNQDVGAAIASGSFRTQGMVVAPCSIKTLSSLAYGLADTLIARAGDVCLKEGRPLILLARETPLHAGHLRAMLALAELGAVILPPIPAFYHRPQTIGALIDHTLARVLDRLGIPQTLVSEWSGTPDPSA
jgi:flavin prenyltransferase